MLKHTITKSNDLMIKVCRNVKVIPWLLSAFLVILFSSVNAQSVAVKGKVTDNKGEPVIGANILEKNTTNGTVSDIDGMFSLDIPVGSTLVISAITFADQEIAVTGAGEYNVQMQPSDYDLNEVVVVGYGTRKKIDVTGAVASISLEKIKEMPNTNIAQFLQGTVPGLNVGVATTAGGTPPISIRGRVSLNGNQNVLIILDGIQYTGSLSSINPDDIATIDVLKDASSTAIYGAQAANGVLLITSRRGKTEKPRISLRSSYTTQEPTLGALVPRDRAGYLEALTEAFYDKAYTAESGYTVKNPAFNLAAVADGSMRDASGALLTNDFNWWKAGTKTGTILENNLSVSGGSEKVNYLLSGGLVDQKGFIINDKFARKSLRANLEVKPLSWWKVGVISSASFVNQDGAEPAIGTLQSASPLHVPYDANGNLIISPTNTIELNAFTTYEVDDYERHNYLFANLYNEISVPFIKGLTYRINYGNNARQDKNYRSSKFDAGQTGRAYKDDQSYQDYTLDNILSYDKSFSKHDVGVTLLYGAIERKFLSTFSEGRGFSRLTLSYNDLALANSQFANSDAWNEALQYQMGRLSYKYNNRYLLTGTVRRDGFSGFAKNNKYGIFPTLALGWVASEESFIKGIKAIDLLKFRAGYGVNGNQTSRYSSVARLTTSAAYVFGDGGSTEFGQQVSTLGNDNLKWERTKGLNIGLDYSLFNNRTTGSFDVYNNNTFDLLFSVAIPSITGFNNITTNLGQINNKGFEAALTHNIINKKDFSWSSTVNFSKNINKIITLTGQDLDKDGKEDDLISSGLFIGKSINTIYDYQANGVYNLTATRLPGFPVGSMSVVDQNKDNDITAAADRVFLGRQEPAYRISLMNNISYKGFGLSVFFNSVQGGKDGYLAVNRPLANNIPQYYREDNTIRWNTFQGVDYWSPNNPNGKYPRNISGARAKVEPNMYEDRSFIRLQDISLSYNFAGSLLKKANAQNLNIFVSAKNLKTWTNWSGWDPESSQVDNNGNLLNGLSTGGRPVLKAITIGANITY
jgi:TonB-dependent starch-binding outer membrane protein SusC